MDPNQGNFTPVQTPPPAPQSPPPGAPNVPSFPSQPPTAGAPEASGAKSSRWVKFFAVFLTIVGLLALGGIGYSLWYHFHNQVTPTSLVMPTKAPVPTVTVVPTVSQDDSTATTEQELNQTTLDNHATDSGSIDKSINGL